MASYNAGEGSRSGKKGRGRSRDGRGKKNFTEKEFSDTSNYSLRNTQSRRSGFTECFEDPNPIHETGEYSRQQGPKSTQRGNPRNVNKNTHVVYFWRIDSPYSQFHSANFTIKDTRYSCAEQFMMSSKARIFDDPKSLASILNAKAPAVMKRFGRGVENFDPSIWKMCCRQYVQEGNIAKFSQNPHLLEELLSTEDRYLAEASPSDKIWGIGMAENNPQANNPNSWKGTNWLGEALNLVKFEFQTIIFFISNKDKIEEVPAKMLFDLFKVCTREYFDKMKCEIIISEDEGPSYTLASKRSSKFNQRKKKTPKSVEVEEHLAPNFDVQLPDEVEIGASEKVKHESDEENSLGEKLKSNERTEFPQNSGQEQTPKSDRKGADEKKSPLSKRKTSPNAEAQSSKEKTKYKKIAFNPEPEPPIISASIQTAVGYILTDWVRLKLLENIPLLKQFMGLEVDELEGLKGNCTYRTDFEVINPGITISSVLIDLRREFNQLEHIFANQTSFIDDLNCATTPPVFPTRKPNPKERSSILSWFPKKSQTTSQKVKSSKKLDTPANEATETLDEPDNIAPEYTEISPPNVQETSTQEDTNVTADKPIEGDGSETTPMEQGESLVGDSETNNPEELAKNTETSPTEPEKSTTEDTEVVSKEETKKDVASTTPPDDLSGGNEERRKSQKKKKSKTDNQDTEIVSKKETTEVDVTPISPPSDPNMGKEESEIKSKKQKKSTEDNEGRDSVEMHFDKSTAEDAKVVSKMDVTPTSSSEDPNGGMEGGKRKSKKKKKSPDDDQETDSAKRHKNNSEKTAKLVPYASSSHSDQDSPKDSRENETPETREKSHPKSSPATKSANETQMSLEATTLDKSEDVKQKPSDTETTTDT